MRRFTAHHGTFLLFRRRSANVLSKCWRATCQRFAFAFCALVMLLCSLSCVVVVCCAVHGTEQPLQKVDESSKSRFHTSVTAWVCTWNMGTPLCCVALTCCWLRLSCYCYGGRCEVMYPSDVLGVCIVCVCVCVCACVCVCVCVCVCSLQAECGRRTQ